MKNRNLVVILSMAALFCLVVIIAVNNRNNTTSSGARLVPGQITLHTTEFPKSFNYYISNASDAATVFNLVYDSLMDVNSETLEFEPLIAQSWTISADKKEFTVKINPKAKWADGQPITAQDVKFTYETIMEPKNLTSVQRLYLSRFLAPEIIDEYTIKFIAKTIHYNNLITLAGLNILPKHIFEGKDFNKAFNMNLPGGSGPYSLSEVKEGRYFTLKRKSDYWADQLPNRQGKYNFDRIKYKVIRDENVAFEAFKKGDFDIFTDISAKRWVTETNSEQFVKNWIVKKKVFNYAPQDFSGLAFNMRRPLFQDLKIRQAIFYLIDRKTLLEKIMFNEYQPLTSYWPSLYGSNTSNEPVDYNPTKAKQLLAEAGYDRLDKSGYLINSQGNRLEFTISYSGESFEKHLTLIVDTLKQAGVKANLELLSWATLLKKIEEYKFDTVVIRWSDSLFPDPEQLWHSRHISDPGGSNLPGYQNAQVDRLIDALPPIFNADQRIKIIKQIDGIIYRDVPYALFWGANYSRVFYKNVFDVPKTVFPKYSSSGIIELWKYDPEKIKQYQKAVKTKSALSSEPIEVYYDQAVGK